MGDSPRRGSARGALLWGATLGEYVDEVTLQWLGGLGVVGFFCSLHAARIIAASARPQGPPVTLALLPFVAVPVLALPLSHWLLQGVFRAGTHCGPAPRELVLSHQLADLLLFRAVPLFICAGGALTVALAAAYVARPLSQRSSWATIAAGSALSWSFTVSALSVMFLRRKLLGMLDESFDAEATWLRSVAGHHRDYQRSAHTLLLASLVFAAAAMNTRRRLSGLVTLVAVLATAVGVNSASAFDAAQWRWFFADFPIFEDTRLFNPSGAWAANGAVALSSWNHGRAAKLVREDIASRREADAAGLPFPAPGLSVTRDIQDSELRVALRTFREEAVSDVTLFAPVRRFEGAPTALVPLVAYQDSFDSVDLISVRFTDEEAYPGDNLACETIPLEEVSVASLHARAAEATSRGRRLVVLVPRTPLE